MRLCLIASKPTDAVTHGFLPAAARLGLEVFLLTDQPDAHAGAAARAGADANAGAAARAAAERGGAGTTVPGGAGSRRPEIVACDVHDGRALISRIAGLPAADAVFTNSDHLQAQTGLRAGDLVAFGLAEAYAWNISHHSFLMHPPPAFIYQGQLA